MLRPSGIACMQTSFVAHRNFPPKETGHVCTRATLGIENLWFFTHFIDSTVCLNFKRLFLALFRYLFRVIQAGKTIDRNDMSKRNWCFIGDENEIKPCSQNSILLPHPLPSWEPLRVESTFHTSGGIRMPLNVNNVKFWLQALGLYNFGRGIG